MGRSRRPRRSRSRGRSKRATPSAAASRSRVARARGSSSAVARSAGESRALRDESARPSTSRTVGTTESSTSSARSRIIVRITSTCCASFCPKYTRVGRTIASSLSTTVATPRKWPGSEAPLEDRAQLRDVDPRLEARWIHLVGRRREHDVDPSTHARARGRAPRRADSERDRRRRRTGSDSRRGS